MAHRFFTVSGGFAMVQASLMNRLSFDPFSFRQDEFVAPELDVGGCNVAQALVIPVMVVVRDEASNVDLEITGPEDWPQLCFTPHTAAQRLKFSTNAVALWMALQNEEEPPEVETRPEGEFAIFWRQETMPKVRLFGPEEAMMWNEASKGVRFSVLCEMCAVFDDPENAPARAATYLQSWLTTGMLATAELSVT